MLTPIIPRRKLLEYQKKEQVLGLDNFKKPFVVQRVRAWCNLILQLIFKNKGSTPSDPDHGVGIDAYEFTFIDESIPILNSELMNQVRNYLPDLPVDNIIVDTADIPNRRDPVITILIRFIEDNDESLAILVGKTDNGRVLGFDINI